MSKEIINWLDSDAGWDEVVNEIKSRCNLNNAKYIVMKIVINAGYMRHDVYTPNPAIIHALTDDLSTFLDWLCEREDCKNGCQLMQDGEGNYFFQITGQNFYDKENNYVGTDTVKIWFKEFLW